MKFYFDIPFLSFLQKKDEIVEFVFDDFKYFIESLCDEECIIVNDDDINLSTLSENRFYRLLSRVQNLKSISYDQLSADIEDLDASCFKFYFLNEHVSVEEVRDNHGFYAYSSGELNDVWPKFHSRRANEDLMRYVDSEKSKYHFNSWKDLNEFALPINTIVISDQYLFEFIDSFKFNLDGLLKSIGLKVLKKRKLDIVIITSDLIFSSDKSLKETSFDDRFIRAFEETLKILYKYLDESEFNFSLIKLGKTTNPKSTKVHFRTCITNTTFLNPHHSFTMFGPKENVRKNEYLDIKSLLWKGPREASLNGAIKIASKALKNVKAEEKYYDQTKKDFVTVKRVLIHNEKRCGVSHEMDV